MKCVRGNCTRVSNRQGLCQQHYRKAVRGYIDATPVHLHIKALRSRGWSLQRVAEASGMSERGLYILGDRVQAMTAQRILCIPIPADVDGGALIDATGTRRRVQALMTLGWTQTVLAPQMGFRHVHLSQIIHQQSVTAATAAKVKRVYDALHMTPGRSVWVRGWAHRRGWQPPLAWDDIDNPAETPNVGENVHITAQTRIDELYELGVRNVHDIARRLGIKPKSVERQLYPSRYREAS